MEKNENEPRNVYLLKIVSGRHVTLARKMYVYADATVKNAIDKVNLFLKKAFNEPRVFVNDEEIVDPQKYHLHSGMKIRLEEKPYPSQIRRLSFVIEKTSRAPLDDSEYISSTTELFRYKTISDEKHNMLLEAVDILNKVSYEEWQKS